MKKSRRASMTTSTMKRRIADSPPYGTSGGAGSPSRHCRQSVASPPTRRAIRWDASGPVPMCYRVLHGARPSAQSVGVRELRENLSVYLDRVKQGEAFEVTEHGHPVARSAPNLGAVDPLDRLIGEGRAVSSRRSHKDLSPPPRSPECPSERSCGRCVTRTRGDRPLVHRRVGTREAGGRRTWFRGDASLVRREREGRDESDRRRRDAPGAGRQRTTLVGSTSP